MKIWKSIKFDNPANNSKAEIFLHIINQYY